MNIQRTCTAILLLGCLHPTLACVSQEMQARDSRLIEAAKQGNLNAIRAALKAGANPNAKGENGQTVLEIVSYGGRIYDQARTLEEINARLDSVKLLVERGAKVDVNREANFPYHIVANAFYEGRYELAQFLLDRGGDPRALDIWNIMRPPRFPIKQLDVVRRKLFEKALARNIRKPQYAPLVEAAASDDGVYFTRRLLEAGYDPNQRHYSGMTPLLVAIENDRPEVVALLLKYKANVQQMYKRPARLSYVSVEILMEKKTPLRLAREKKRKKIIALLEKAGASETPPVSKEKPQTVLKPQPLNLRFREVSPHNAGNDRVGIVIEVTNPNSVPLSCFAYRPGGLLESVELGSQNISPLYQIEMRKNGNWQPNQVGWCGTGAGPVTIPPKATKTFTAFVAREGWERIRVGLSWFPSARRAEPVVAWSEPIIPEDLEKQGNEGAGYVLYPAQ